MRVEVHEAVGRVERTVRELTSTDPTRNHLVSPSVSRSRMRTELLVNLHPPLGDGVADRCIAENQIL